MKALPLLMRLVAIAALVLPARPALAAQLIVVGPTQPIQPALDRALPGDVVQVEGTHVENVVLRAGVTLRGGKGAILTSGRAPVVRIQGVKGATLESLTIRLTGKPSDERSLAAVTIGKADATVQGCLVNSCAIGVKVRLGAAPRLIGNVLSHCRSGLVFEDDARGEAIDNTVRNNKRAGIGMQGSAAPTLRHNILEASAVIDRS
ncbi:MAG: right-handed parallel beta-helix repeat-containing protein [bacterium]|nr:right-handed parallel beta-helix repeat-containing protein [bacterium]